MVGHAWLIIKDYYYIIAQYFILAQLNSYVVLISVFDEGSYYSYSYIAKWINYITPHTLIAIHSIP